MTAAAHHDPDAGALEAVRTGLEQLMERIVDIADARRVDPDEPLVSDLDELERSLKVALRRLDRILRRVA
ncbi:MAG: hypothetical protein H0W25_11510 [Acidimicrobiia bacterium]|nr:hypothetical protein [Acidimicrobiia bacterium]